MRRSFTGLVITAMSLLIVTACGGPAVTAAPTSVPPQPSATVVSEPTATSVPPTVAPTQTASPTSQTSPTPTSGAVVSVAKSALGQILVDDKGMTLYIFTKDAGGVSTCYEACATSWPALITKDKPKAGDGVDSALLGTAARKDGSLQVIYNKMPLYYFAKDKAPGDTTGQGVGTVWFALAPNGNMIKPDQIAINTPSATNTPNATSTPKAVNTPQPTNPPSATSIPNPTNTPGTAGTPALGGPGQTVGVSAGDYEFSPKVITVKVGTTVQWANQGQTDHNVAFDNGSFSTGNFAAGQSGSFTFNEAGTYHYYCSLHGGAGGTGMAGTIIVVQ